MLRTTRAREIGRSLSELGIVKKSTDTDAKNRLLLAEPWEWFHDGRFRMGGSADLEVSRPFC